MIRTRISRRAALMGMGAAGISFSMPKGALADAGKVNFYNWDTYIGETTLEDFTEATGIEIQMDLYADNDELFAKLRNGNPGYDVVVPTNDTVEKMIAAGLLQKLDHSKIPNIANLDQSFMEKAFDPGRQYSLPYMWGSIGIGYRKSAVDEVPDSWSYLFTSEKYAGRIAMLSEAQTVLGMALKLMGKSLNDWTPENLAAAEAMLIKQKPNITAFAPDNGQDLLYAGEVDLVMEWSGDMLQVINEDDDLGYVIPKEGGLLWEDTLCIPTGAPNPEGAHAFINYLLDAEAGAKIAEFIQFSTPNAAARALTSEDYRDNPAIFPPAEALAKSEPAVYAGQEMTRAIDEAWTRIKAAG